MQNKLIDEVMSESVIRQKKNT